MKRFFSNLALVPRGLRYKLIIIFCLMSIVPILTLLYIISTYVLPDMFPAVRDFPNILNFSIALSLFIALLGFILARTIIEPIIKMAKNAKCLVNGEFVPELEVKAEDEIGDLGTSLNLLTSRLNDNMSELKSYEHKIRAINMEINKKVLALSTLFQIGTVMSSASDLNVILQFVIEKAYELIKSEKSFLMLIEEPSNELVVKAVHNIKAEDIQKIKIKVGQGVLGKVVSANKTAIVDAKHKAPETMKEFLSTYGLRNIIIAPVVRRFKPIGLIACGNNLNGFSYQEDDEELINIFAKQASLAVENDLLLKKTEELSITDDLTGLYNINYLRTRLEEEIQRAITYQRPCSFILTEVDDFENYKTKNGELTSDALIKRIAKVLEKNVEQVDRVARFTEAEFAIICPEKNKNEALMLAENIRKEIEKFKFPHSETQPIKKITISGGISANPIDGITPDELINKARELIKEAKEKGKNRIVS